MEGGGNCLVCGEVKLDTLIEHIGHRGYSKYFDFSWGGFGRQAETYICNLINTSYPILHL